VEESKNAWLACRGLGVKVLIVEGRKSLKMPAAGAFDGRVGTRGGTRLTSAKLVGTSQNTGLGGLSGLSSRLNGLRGGVSGMLLAPRVAPSRSPSHADAPSQSGLFPQFFCQLCVTTSAAAIGQLDVGIKQSLEEKWRNARRGGVPLAHSRRSLTQTKFLRWTYRS
jgi:hypothetical protein